MLKNGELRVNLLAVLLFVLLTVVAAWPVVSHLDKVIIGDDPDVYINIWADWWTQKALTDDAVSLWHTDTLFYPQGANLSYHSFSHLNTAVSLALRPIFGILGGYNVTILLNFMLAGFAMFQLARYLTGSTAAAIIAGIVFAFNSHSQYQSAHPVLVSIWCFPWVTLLFMRAVRENRLALAAAAAVVVFLGAATSTLLLILLAMWMGMLVVYMFYSRDWPRPTWKTVVLFGVISAALSLPLNWPLIREAIAGGNSSFLMQTEEAIQADMFTLLLPHWYLWHSRALYLGIAPLYLALVAAGSMRKEAGIWLLLFLAAYLLSIGPQPEILGTPIVVTLPWSSAVVPLIRNTYRFNILAAMGLAMITAYGMIGIGRQIRSTRKFRFFAALIAVVTFVEYAAPPFPSTNPEVSEFYSSYLASVPDRVALAILPSGRQAGKGHMYLQTIHEHPIVDGTISRPAVDTFDFINRNELLYSTLMDTGDMTPPETLCTSLAELADRGVGFVIIEKHAFEPMQWREAFMVEPVFEDDLLMAYDTALGRIKHCPES